MHGIRKIVNRTNNLNNNNNNNNTIYVNQYIEPGKLADIFSYKYYYMVSNFGWNTIYPLFDKNCTNNCKNFTDTHNCKQNLNVNEFVDVFKNAGIKRANFDDLSLNWVIVSNNRIVINVFGDMQFVAVNEQLSEPNKFAESFVLENNNGNILCIHHTLDF